MSQIKTKLFMNVSHLKLSSKDFNQIKTKHFNHEENDRTIKKGRTNVKTN